MAGPTIDSDPAVGGGISTLPPLGGAGSKTPIPPKGPPAGIGGGPSILPAGMPGAPAKTTSPEEEAEKATLTASVDKLVEDISDKLSIDIKDKDLLDKDIVELVDDLLDLGWSFKTLRKLIRKSKMKSIDFFKKLIKKVQRGDDEGAVEFLKKKLNEDIEQKKNPEGMGEISGLGGLPPPVKAYIMHNNRNFDKREGYMGNKIMVKNGTLVAVPETTKKSLSKLVEAIRYTKKAISNYESHKLKYAGNLALKFALDNKAKKDDTDIDTAGLEDFEELGDEMVEMDLEEETDVDKEMLLDGLEDVKDGIKKIDDALNNVESEMENAEEETAPEDFEITSNLMEEGKEVAAKARQIIKYAKKELKNMEKKFREDSSKKEKKNKKKDQQAMNVTIGKSAGLSEDDTKNDNKKDESIEEEEQDTKDLLEKVKERLARLREERKKESQLYPFTDLNKQKVDNTNATTAKQQYSAANKKYYASDKDNDTINPAIGQADLPYTTEGKSTNGKGVSPAISSKISAEDARYLARSIQNAVDKARLSVELASQQQLKGLLDNPLKQAFIKNMTEAGIPADTAEAIAYNSFIDGYEDSQKIIMKEAFQTFMEKPIDDFIKVAKFTKDHLVKEAIFSVDTIESVEGRIKSASTIPLRGSQITDNKREEYRKFWQQVGRSRRGF